MLCVAGLRSLCLRLHRGHSAPQAPLGCLGKAVCMAMQAGAASALTQPIRLRNSAQEVTNAPLLGCSIGLMLPNFTFN